MKNKILALSGFMGLILGATTEAKATTWACHDTVIRLGTYVPQVQRISQSCGWRSEYQHTVDEVAQLAHQCNSTCSGDVYELNQCLSFAQSTDRAVQIASSCSGPSAPGSGFPTVTPEVVKTCGFSWETSFDKTHDVISVREYLGGTYSNTVLFMGTISFPRVVNADGSSRPVYMIPRESVPQLFAQAIEEATLSCDRLVQAGVCSQSCAWN